MIRKSFVGPDGSSGGAGKPPSFEAHKKKKMTFVGEAKKIHVSFIELPHYSSGGPISRWWPDMKQMFGWALSQASSGRRRHAVQEER